MAYLANKNCQDDVLSVIPFVSNHWSVFQNKNLEIFLTINTLKCNYILITDIMSISNKVTNYK
jgi:hypothetical protein